MTAGEATGVVPVEELLRLADRIERDHAKAGFCACCTPDAIYLRDLAARHTIKTPPARETT